MAEESEKRFKDIMDKLFHAPSPRKSLPISNSGNQSSRGVKRPNTAMYSSIMNVKSKGNLVEAMSNSWVARGSGQAPLCRPWDRGDLMKRLATFKSMTWFAKPQVVNAVNCARRGWINVDSDTISCESCGARLFFSTPSAWMQHQVEKAALVFSLKLDSGHKLLCPWIDNACDETLAQFPPTQAEVLVNEYKKRFSALMNLLALPVVSASAINHMKSPLLKHFLGASSDDRCSGSPGVTSSEGLEMDNEMVSSRSYHQAQMLISLCGWEPRLLPYTVDCKNQQNESGGNGKFSELSKGVSNEHCSSLIVYSSGKEANIGASNNSVASEQCDPSSVVLDCKLCGASVGLWAFSTVPQPLELLRIVGYTEVGQHDDSTNPEKSAIGGEGGTSGAADVASVYHLENRRSTICAASTSATPSTERRLSLNMTIAGGPPPAKQNFKATISLPVIGRNLRARFSSDPDFRDRFYLKNAVVEGIKHGESTIAGSSSPSRDKVLLHDEHVDDIPETSALVSVVDEPVPYAPSLVEGSSKDGTSKDVEMPENAENSATMNVNAGVGDITQAGDCSMAATCEDLTITNGKNTEGDDSMAVEVNISDSSLIPVNDIICNTPADSQDGNGTVDKAQPLNEYVQPTKRAENLCQLRQGEGMEFDPVGQHRPFCPWIASASNSPPGWQQLLSALHRQHEFSCPSGATDAPSSPVIEVDDPITSIRKLFTPPSAKRTKLVHDSS